MFFFFNDTATTEIYTLSLHDALPIFDEIEPDFSGVCFSLVVATNQDQTMLLEYVKGSAMRWWVIELD